MSTVSSIEDMRREDWKQVRALYAEGLATGLAAFMTDPPRWEAWDDGHLDIGRLVTRAEDKSVIGWAALAPVPDT
ncbi:MAG: L-amino acid N-acyltransferase YncA [Paracoccaceae bacterium]|jgi:L-amino acid N-acyltransferase YncA